MLNFERELLIALASSHIAIISRVVVGLDVGDKVGVILVGDVVGSWVLRVGSLVGSSVVGSIVGRRVGILLGTNVGLFVG